MSRLLLRDLRRLALPAAGALALGLISMPLLELGRILGGGLMGAYTAGLCFSLGTFNKTASGVLC